MAAENKFPEAPGYTSPRDSKGHDRVNGSMRRARKFFFEFVVADIVVDGALPRCAAEPIYRGIRDERRR